MSRLQVGGLALELTTGEVVTLISFFGDGFGRDGKEYFNNWLVEFEGLVSCELTGKLSKTLYVQEKQLMPLGDKHSQEKLIDECYSEYS